MRTIDCSGRTTVPGKIICVGKNYLDHAREMGGDPPFAEPTIFLKPNSAIAPRAPEVFIPEAFGLLHHEVELCCVLGRGGRDIDMLGAMECIGAWGVGIDFTLRERQRIAKEAGGPWDLAKGFDHAAVFGSFTEYPGVDPLSADIRLHINGELRQASSASAMIFSPAAIVAFVSRFMTLDVGDVVMTGTPAGVGEVRHGDLVEGAVAGLPALAFTVLRHRPSADAVQPPTDLPSSR